MHAKVFSIQIFQYFHQIPRRVCTLVLFIAFVEECNSERESRRFEQGLSTELKLDIYKRCGKSVEFKEY